MRRITLEKNNIHDVAHEASEVLTKGGVVLYPTDTVYGLGADATNVQAVDTVRRIKGREDTKPLLILVRDVAMMERYLKVTSLARTLASLFLPGRLSLLGTINTDCSEMLSTVARDGQIGIRIIDHPFCLMLTQHDRATLASLHSASRPTKTVSFQCFVRLLPRPLHRKI